MRIDILMVTPGIKASGERCQRFQVVNLSVIFYFIIIMILQLVPWRNPFVYETYTILVFLVATYQGIPHSA